MIIIGLTGGIGTGKSTASEYFKSIDIPVVDADLIARLVVEPGKPAYYEILKHFGHFNILNSNSHELNRDRLGEIIFSNGELRKRLNKCTHGYIRREALKQIIEHFLKLKSIVIWDVPLLFEVGLDRYLSHTLVISCDKTIQLNRLKQRNNYSDDDQAIKRINAQMDLDEKCRRARYVIDNSGTKDVLLKDLENFVLTIQPNQITTLTWFILLSVPLLFTYGFLRIWDFYDKTKDGNKRS